MKFTKSVSPVRALLLIAAIFLMPAATQGKDAWTSVTTKNFTLVGNASEKEIKEVATRLEQFRDVFSRLFPRMKLSSSTPTTVVVFKNNNSFKPYKPVADGKIVEVAGYFQAGRDVNYIALSTDRTSEDNFRIIFHEYVHLLINNSFGRAAVPPWFNEGLAEYYSTFEIADSRKVSLGVPIANHLYLLRASKLWPLQRLLGIDYYSLERNGHDSRGIFYAQSWALIHYLLQGDNGVRRPELGRFIDLLLAQTPLEQAFREAFKVDFATVGRELGRYIQQSRYNTNVATFERKLEFDADMTSRPLTEAQALTYLGDLLHHMQRTPEAMVKLREALKLEPNLSMANASLGIALAYEEKFEEAKSHLAKAVADDSSSYLAHFYYAYALSKQGMNEELRVENYSAEDAATMRAELAKSIKANPDFAESYNLLAFVNLVTNQNLNEAMDQIKKAIKLSPGNEHYAFIMAQIQMRRQEFAAARKTVEPLATSSSDPRIRSTAEGMLKAINDYETHIAEVEKENARPRTETHTQLVDTSVGPQTNEVEIDPVAYLEEALRKPGAGELRVQGILKRIDCTPKAITFTVQAGTQLLKFSSTKFENLRITSFTNQVTGELTCGTRKGEEAIVVTYAPGKDLKTKSEGTVVSLEFVPREFKLKTR